MRDITKCWELYEYFTTTKASNGKEEDEFMLSYMIRLCSATHDSEKAIRLFNNLETDGFVKHAMPYNSIIFALASTKRFAKNALEYWYQMHAHNVMPDKHTFVAVLKACS